jgi:hypothetical protein
MRYDDRVCAAKRRHLSPRVDEQGGECQRRQDRTYDVKPVSGVAYLLPIGR